MANSQKPGPANPPMDWCLSPALTPGPLGLFDQGDPNATTLLGDTPGPLGMNDANDPSMSPFGSAMDYAMFISQDTIRRALENDSADARAAASAAAKPSSAAWERTEQSRVPAWNPAAADRVMGNLLANSERFAANKSSPDLLDRIAEQGHAVLDATAEAVGDVGRTLLRAVTIDTPDEARERAERIELLRAQNFRKLLGAELRANGMIDNGMVCRRVGPMAVAVQPASAHPAYYDSFDQRIARSTADALELYASGALINAVAMPILTAGGKLTLRFLSTEAKLSYGLRQELRSSLHADLRPTAKLDGLSPRVGGAHTADVAAVKIAKGGGTEPVQASRLSDARGPQGASPSISQLATGSKIEGGAPEVIAGANRVSEAVAAARVRQSAMLQDNIGFNISPLEWDAYPTIGRSGTFVSDKQGVMKYFGDISGKAEISISSSTAAQIEQDMGLVSGTLQGGFKVRQVTDIREMLPMSPLEGNQHFLGAGNHLPGGAPEMVISSIPTIDSSLVKTILKIKVGAQ